VSGRIVIIGAGQAGAQAAASLRAEGYAGEIVMVGAETAPPYQRPPLSKAYLKGELDSERLWLRPLEFYARDKIDLRLGVPVVAIERAAQQVRLSNGERVAYDKLLLATGAPARRLEVPGADLPGVFYLRTLKDSDALRPVPSSEKPLVIVGAGYIGLEVAAVARSAGLDVTVVEAADRPLARVAGPALSAHILSLHRSRGVEFILGDGIAAIEGREAVEAVALRSGVKIPCGAVVAGIGAEPAVALANEAGLQIDNGVVVDEFLTTSDPCIHAAGDVANFPSSLYGRRMRLESVPNAIDQGKTAAANMAGRRVAHDAVPWFWSDQYETKLQTAGVFSGANATVVRENGAQFSVWYLKDDRLLAVDAVNDPQSFAVGKRLVGSKAAVDAKTLADPATDLKSLLR
jgi:3-phenylpropionate/trans-cinnamate dioxygenase ferredoxin reductase subunit